MTKSINPSKIYRENYWTKFREHAHEIIAIGYQRALPKIKQSTEEEEISGFICGEIETYFSLYNCPTWLTSFSVHNESPIHNSKSKGKRRKKIDILVEWTRKQRRPRYLFEAKCLNRKKAHQNGRNYLGSEGIRRFFNGEYFDYSSRYPEVAMIGFVLSDSPGWWRDKLKMDMNLLQNELAIKGVPIDVKIVSTIPIEWQTLHDRRGDDFNVFHVLLECC